MDKNTKLKTVHSVALAAEVGDQANAERMALPCGHVFRCPTIFTPLELQLFQQRDEIEATQKRLEESVRKGEILARAWLSTPRGKERWAEYHATDHEPGCTCVDDLLAEQDMEL